jgi:hypothetical protein
MLSGISNSKWKGVKNLGQHQPLLFPGAEKMPIFAQQFIQNLVIKTPTNLCKNCRGLVDLQLCHSQLDAL